MAHNKTLAAQLFSEFKDFFPDNEVHYFVSYFDYYQPEAYIASSDTYIEKDSKINDEIDRLRHAATSALLTRRDVIIVASVSCIYGIGSPETYADMAIKLTVGERRVQGKFIRLLTDIQYKRNDIDFVRGTFRVRGDVVDIFPAGQDTAVRVEFFGDEIERLTKIDPLTGEILDRPDQLTIFPSSHYSTPRERIEKAIVGIENEFNQRLKWFEDNGKFLEAQRLSQRTKYDLEMLKETGFVKGIENYSRYLTDREPGEQPATLIDYFPDDWLLLVDESHIDISRKFEECITVIELVRKFWLSMVFVFRARWTIAHFDLMSSISIFIRQFMFLLRQEIMNFLTRQSQLSSLFDRLGCLIRQLKFDRPMGKSMI